MVRSKKAALVGLAVAVAAVPHLLDMFQPFFLDEWSTLRNVVEFSSNRTFIPYHTNYPTFYSYLAAPFVAAGAIFHWLASEIGTAPETVAFLYKLHPLQLALPARLLSVLLLAGAAVVVYRDVAARYGEMPGLASGLLVLLSPSLHEYGSYALPDVAVLAFCVFSFSSLLKFSDLYPVEPAGRCLMVSAAMAGLAISAKYQAASAVVPIAVTILVLLIQGRIRLSVAFNLASYSAVCCIVAFLLGSPGWVFATAQFKAGLLFEIFHAEQGHLGFLGLPLLGQIELLATDAPIIFLSGIAGICVWFRNRTTDGWIALAAVCGSLGLASISSKQSLQYLFPGYVGWLYFTAIFVNQMQDSARNVVLVTFVAIAAILYGQGLIQGLNYFSPNTNALAEQWIYQNVPKNEVIATDWAYVPRLYSPTMIDEIRQEYGKYSGPILREIFKHKTIYNVLDIEYAKNWLETTPAKYIVTSDLVFRRFFCTGMFTQMLPAVGTSMREGFDQRKAFYSSLFNRKSWRLARSFSTGNGPETYIFRRVEGKPTQDDDRQQKNGTFINC